jgi:hypothetical protein
MLLGKITIETGQAMQFNLRGLWGKLTTVFILPKTVRRLWVSFYDTADERHRAPVRIVHDDVFPEILADLPGDDIYWVWENALFDGLLMSIGNRECFLQVEYEE